MASGLLDYLSNSGQGLLNMYRQAPGVLGDWAMNTAAPALMSLSPGAAIQDSMQSGRDAGASLQGGDYMGALKNTGLGLLAAGGVIPGAGTAERAGVQGIRAFHGSPHSFDVFDLSKIGSGEGAQAYGHGLYFAGNEDVARSYRDALTGPGMRITTGDGASTVAAPSQFVGPLMDAMTRAGIDGPAYMKTAIARAHLENAADLPEAAFKNAFGSMALSPENEAQARQKLAQMVEQASPTLSSYKVERPGNMYEVNINADPGSLLDWDKPLSQQSPQVQEALAKVGVSGKTGADAYKALGERLAPDLTMGGRFPGIQGLTDPEAASEALRNAGIPGIQYLDQGSRGAGEGSRNYVVFHDQLVNILRKYGLAGMLGGGGAAAGYGLLAPSDAQAGQEQR
jgi:hypothetical protein